MPGKRGFASMDADKQREIASKGGKAAHAKGTAHEFTREEAVEAGRKGGRAAQARGRARRTTEEEAAEGPRRAMPAPGEERSTDWHEPGVESGRVEDFAGSRGR